MKREYIGINVQYPISELILRGVKTIETRTYPIPKDFIGKEMVLIETPGKRGKFKARIRAIVVFSKCFQYESAKSFYRDGDRHHVTPTSEWAWKPGKPKWGWEVKIKKILKEPIPTSKKKGIVYTHGIQL